MPTVAPGSDVGWSKIVETMSEIGCQRVSVNKKRAPNPEMDIPLFTPLACCQTTARDNHLTTEHTVSDRSLHHRQPPSE